MFGVPHCISCLHVFMVKILYIYELCALIERIKKERASIFSISETCSRIMRDLVYAHFVLFHNDLSMRLITNYLA